MNNNMIKKNKITKDRYRPKYHFLPPSNWICDPIGLIFWHNKYHLFYQYNPYKPVFEKTCWGHTISKDLVHWERLPIGISPTPNGYDRDGCLSGCAIDNNGKPTIFYTGAHPEVQCMATSNDELITWQKYPDNPIISSMPKDLKLVGFRDPCVWRENESWHMLIGSGIREIGGTALLYKSKDLINWEYMNPLFLVDKAMNSILFTGTMWECPDFFVIGEKHVLIISVLQEDDMLYSVYFIGKYINFKFVPERINKPDWGDDFFYAPRTLLDGKGRRIMLGWIKEGRSEKEQKTAGWAGVTSLPRALSILPNGLLGFDVVEELKTLRNDHHRVEEVSLSQKKLKDLTRFAGDCVEIIAEFELGEAQQVGLKILHSPKYEEQTIILYDNVLKCLVVDGSGSSLNPEAIGDLKKCPLVLLPGENLRLHVFIDKSVLEVFSNSCASITSRIYPIRSDSQMISLFISEGEAKLKSMDIYSLNTIW